MLIDHTSGRKRAWVEWDEAGVALCGEQNATWLPVPEGEPYMLRIAYSLAANGLAHTIPGLDRNNLSLVLAAIAHAGGSHNHFEVRPDPNGRMVLTNPRKRVSRHSLGSLYQWPEP